MEEKVSLCAVASFLLETEFLASAQGIPTRDGIHAGNRYRRRERRKEKGQEHQGKEDFLKR